MLDETMKEAMEEFILTRINDYGRVESGALQEAATQLCSDAEMLRGKLSAEQSALLTRCENTFAVLDGETKQYYYRAGFSDAVFFLLGWRELAEDERA